MHLQVGVDPQDHFTRSSRALAGNDGHASILPLDVVALSIWPDDAERTDAAVRGQLRASSYKVSPDRKVDLLVDDPEAHTLCHPTNCAFRGEELFTSNLGRWHITRIDVGTEGLSLP